MLSDHCLINQCLQLSLGKNLHAPFLFSHHENRGPLTFDRQAQSLQHLLQQNHHQNTQPLPVFLQCWHCDLPVGGTHLEHKNNVIRRSVPLCFGPIDVRSEERRVGRECRTEWV